MRSGVSTLLLSGGLAAPLPPFLALLWEVMESVDFSPFANSLWSRGFNFLRHWHRFYSNSCGISSGGPHFSDSAATFPGLWKHPL